MFSLEDKVDIILILFIFTVLFHILFFIKPEWFGLEHMFKRDYEYDNYF